MELTRLRLHAATIADMAWSHASRSADDSGEPQALAVSVQGFMDELLAVLTALQPAPPASAGPTTAP